MCYQMSYYYSSVFCNFPSHRCQIFSDGWYEILRTGGLGTRAWGHPIFQARIFWGSRERSKQHPWCAAGSKYDDNVVVAYFISTTSGLCLVVQGWGWRCQDEVLSAQASAISSPVIPKWLHATHRRGREDIRSDRSIWEGVKRTVWFSPWLPGTDANVILVITAQRGEMTQLKLHWLLHYNQEWWKEEKDGFKNSFQWLFLWFR